MKTTILPGMGADATMYPKSVYENLSEVTFIDWPPYYGESSLEAVAKSVIKHYYITDHMIVGGSSLGGMVAVQIAKVLNIKKVILIGSATDPKYVNPVLKSLRSQIEKAPIELFQFIVGKMNIGSGSDLLAMFEKADNRFIRAMCKAIFRWEGIGDYQCHLCQIHGSADKVIFPPKKDVEIIQGGGHLIAMIHGELVTKLIRDSI